MDIIIRDKKVKGIPLLEVFGADRAAQSPVLFFVHEFSVSKESHLDLGYRFAKQGYIVVLFDAHFHGELETPEFRQLNGVAKLEKLPELWTGTGEYLFTLVRYYKEHPGTQDSPIGLMGISMGGFAIFHYLSREARDKIDAAVCLNSSPSWRSSFELVNAKHPGKEIRFTEEYLKTIQDIQPSNFLEHFDGVPILILNGEQDDKFSIDDLSTSVERLKTLYLNESHVKSIVYKGVAHQVTRAMLQESEKWLGRFLPDHSPS